MDLQTVIILGAVGMLVLIFGAPKLWEAIKAKAKDAVEDIKKGVVNTVDKSNAVAVDSSLDKKAAEIKEGVDYWVHMKSMDAIKSNPEAQAALDVVMKNLLKVD